MGRVSCALTVLCTQLPDSEIDAIADLPRLAAIKGDATAEKMTVSPSPSLP